MLSNVFTPCCVPAGAGLAMREIQMESCFRDNLLGTNGACPKTQTIRAWCTKREAEHYTSYISGLWVRVWRGVGHRSTIGWLRFTSWDKVPVGRISQEDCVREGRPLMTPMQFVLRFFPGVSASRPMRTRTLSGLEGGIPATTCTEQALALHG